MLKRDVIRLYLLISGGLCKKGVPLFLAAAVILSGMGSASSGQQARLTNFTKTAAYDSAFSDIDGHWAESYITNAYEYGIVNGMGGGVYSPDGYLTVAQAITFAARLHMTYNYSGEGQSVLDEYAENAESGHWAASYIACAEGEKLTADDWSDELDRPITRAEAIRVWSRVLLPEDMAKINTVNNLPDVTPATPYFAEILNFYEAGIVQGSTINGTQNCFNPNGTFTRAQAAAVFIRMAETEERISGQTYGKGVVQKLAGTGSSGSSGNTSSAGAFTIPQGLAADNDGGIVVFDTYGNAIRVINDGKVELIAGQRIANDESGLPRGYYRDGVLSMALFNRPSDGVYNTDGDLFVCDSENSVIRIIQNGTVYTCAGTVQGYADGAADEAQFNTPMAIAIDQTGNLYVADTLNNCIRMIDANGFDVTTIAGTPGKGGYADGDAGQALFLDPSGIAVSGDGSVIYVADTGNHRIRIIEDGVVRTLCGITVETDTDGDPSGGYQDGASDNAMFNLPKGLTLAEDILFVADSGNNVIRAVSPDGCVTTAAGTGEPGDAAGGMLTSGLSQPAGILWHEGVLYIADSGNNIIKTLTADLSIFRDAFALIITSA